MSNKAQINPFKLVAAKSASASFNSPWVTILYQDRGSIIVNTLTGAASGTFQIQGRTSFAPISGVAPEYVTCTGPASEAVDLPSTSQTIGASGTSIGWDITETGYTQVRVNYVAATTTAGTVDIWFAGKRSG